MLDRLDIRLGFIPKQALTVAPAKFGLKTLRERIDHRNAEAASRAFTVLKQAAANTFDVPKTKGHSAQELDELTRLHGLIDEDNALQNSTRSTNPAATGAEGTDYAADACEVRDVGTAGVKAQRSRQMNNGF